MGDEVRIRRSHPQPLTTSPSRTQVLITPALTTQVLSAQRPLAHGVATRAARQPLPRISLLNDRRLSSPRAGDRS